MHDFNCVKAKASIALKINRFKSPELDNEAEFIRL